MSTLEASIRRTEVMFFFMRRHQIPEGNSCQVVPKSCSPRLVLPVIIDTRPPEAVEHFLQDKLGAMAFESRVAFGQVFGQRLAFRTSEMFGSHRDVRHGQNKITGYFITAVFVQRKIIYAPSPTSRSITAGLDELIGFRNSDDPSRGT